VKLVVGFFTACLMLSAFAPAQVDVQPTATVPRLIRITGSARDEAGKPLSGNLGVTFTFYQDEGGQLPVWQETQNVQLDSSGRFHALLGATSETGLPLEIFAAGAARWLGVRPDGQEEQPRILFVSVAYALKAADTEMLGGRPASAYLLAGGQNLAVQGPAASPASVAAAATLPLLVSPLTTCSAVTSDGTATANQVAKFTTACNIENSAIFESGGKVGIGNTTPAGTLDVSGTEVVRGALSLPPTGTATTSQGYISNPLEIEASVYNSALAETVSYIFQWQAEPEGNDTSDTGSSLNLLWGSGSSINETGLSLGRNGIISFASGQTFPGTGSGTVTSVATGAGLTGGPITTSGTISIPSAGVTNAMLANDSITVKAGSGLSGGGTVALGNTVTLSSTTTGTVTSVGTGAGLTGGPITTTGTISIPSAGVTNSMLANNSITVTAGSGLSGGGPVALGGSVSLGANLSGTTDGMAFFASPASVVSTAAPTNGQILIGSSGKAPALGTLTAGSNVSITNGPGSITISASGGGGSPTLPFFVTGTGHTGSSQAATENITKLWGILLPYNVTTTEIIYDVATADKTSNDYDIGLFDNSGSLVVDLGAMPGTTFSASTGFKTLAWAQGSTSLAAGRYYLAFTTNCASACAKIGAGPAAISFAVNASAGATTGGGLPTSITPPADTWTSGNQPAVVIQ
jgi:hypothetical protein